MSEPKDTIESIGLVLKSVVAERLVQEQKWGPQNHNQIVWLGILSEEFGDAAKEVNELHFRRDIRKDQVKTLRAELVQVAAVAVAMIESLDRNRK